MEIVVVLVILGALALFFIATYNRLITLRQRVKEAWADIDVQLKRRHDLIPNLVETVKGYATHESSVFQKVTEARAAAVAADFLLQDFQLGGQIWVGYGELLGERQIVPGLILIVL